MKWQGRRGSANVEDRRGAGSGFGGRMIGGGVGGIGLIIVLVLSLLGGDTGILDGILGGGQTTDAVPRQQATTARTAQEQELFEYASVALADIEDTWNAILPRSEYGVQYQEPTMVVYDGFVQTACGAADSGAGPFYCPGDRRIYIDLSFYEKLVTQYGAARGDYIMAYVIAHEAGHHVQTLLGVTEQLNTLRQRVATGQFSQTEFNRYSVAYELQADYLAGVVARYMAERGLLENGDLREAMSAAAAVGDDAIQRRAQGYVDPDSFNHGTSAQRQEWFEKGYEAGDLSQWDTFEAIL